MRNRYRSLCLVLGVVALAACQDAAGTDDPLGPVSSSELELATAAAGDAEAVAAATHTDARRWFRRLLERLRETDDPEARACLEEAAELRRQAREAYDGGDHELARRLLREAHLKVLCAVVEVFPDAPERTGAAVDEAVARIEERLGDREAPRIRRVLAHVQELRDAADAALADGDRVRALALNLRAFHLLRRLVHYLEYRTGDAMDRHADAELHDMS